VVASAICSSRPLLVAMPGGRTYDRHGASSLLAHDHAVRPEAENSGTNWPLPVMERRSDPRNQPRGEMLPKETGDAPSVDSLRKQPGTNCG
jgi:hypothetical protein